LVPIIITGFISFGLLIFYIIHAVSNKSINTTEQLIWILVFIFVSTIGFPVYWVLRIWNEKEKLDTGY
jgi:TM2 domain-containing membrane protein YozV